MTDQELREALYGAYKHRAILYYLIFDEMRQEVGAEKAKAIMKRAIYRRGEEIGRKYAQFAPADFEGLKEAFVGGSTDDGRMFEPRVERCDAGGLDILHGRCPLKEAWLEAGLSSDDAATMCEIASIVDAGTFEGAGFGFSVESWRPGREGCCHLHVRPGPAQRP